MAEVVVDVAQKIEVGHHHRQRPVETPRTRQLVGERGGEVACVEQARLGVDARLHLEGRYCEGAVDHDERRERQWDQPGIRVPEGRNGDAERREHELGGKRLAGEETGLGDGDAAAEAEHRRKQRVVDEDVDDAGEQGTRGDAEIGVADQAVEPEHPSVDRERCEDRQRVVEDVERPDVPGLPLFQPLGDVLRDRDQGGERRREQERGRQEEDRSRVVGQRSLAAASTSRRDDDEELREGRADRQDRERDPACALVRDLRDERACRDDRRGADEQVEREGRLRQAFAPLPGQGWLVVVEYGRDRAHGPSASAAAAEGVTPLTVSRT